MTARLHRVGVRHHSPACARLVEHTLRTVRPAVVLIEGPSDLNGRLGELLLDHEPPIALFSFLRVDGEASRSSWYPICAYSPEWVALRVGHELGCEVRFMDLPAWHDAFSHVVNLGADHTDRYGEAIQVLCERTGTTGLDALWDHLFESTEDLDTLRAALELYFEELRALGPISARDAAREAHMAQHIGAALAGGGEVVVVCGGYHAPALAVHDAEADPSPRPVSWPEPIVAPAGARAETYLVPYSYLRLDAFTGYQSGMPSPAYYEVLHRLGPAAAGAAMLDGTVERLRRAGQPLSTADLVAVRTQTEALAALRGHRVPLRVDVLDGIASALLKDSLDQPLPWDLRAPLSRRTHPLLVEVVAAFCGERIGRLDARTPRPPLLADAQAEMEACDLFSEGEAVRVRRLDLTRPAQRRASQVAHRLRVLAVPGCDRLGDGLEVLEEWRLEPAPDRDVALIEASVHGPTLASAAAGVLALRLELEAPARPSPSPAPSAASPTAPSFPSPGLAAGVGSSAVVAAVLLDALHCGLDELAAGAIQRAARCIDADHDLAALGRCLELLGVVAGADALFREDHGGGAELGGVVDALLRRTVQRFAWLLESLSGPATGDDDAVVRAMVSLCQTLRRRGVQDVELVRGVLTRRAVALDAPPALRGACLGALWKLDLLGGDAMELAVGALQATPPSQQPGDLLAGLFATAGSLAISDDRLLRAIDALVAGWTAAEFTTLLPALRRAFAWFPPRDRARIGDRIAAVRGLPPQVRLAAPHRHDPQAVAEAAALDELIEAEVRRYGLVAP